jgi:hypothetical protein
MDGAGFSPSSTTMKGFYGNHTDLALVHFCQWIYSHLFKTHTSKDKFLLLIQLLWRHNPFKKNTDYVRIITQRIIQFPGEAEKQLVNEIVVM